MDKYTLLGTLALLVSLIFAPVVAETTTGTAAEELPDSVEHSEEKPEELAERFSAPPLDNDEMEGMYLESPSLAKDDESDAMAALSDKDRYLHNDPLFQEQLRNSQDTITGTPVEEAPVQQPPITSIPELFDRLRQL